jgi:putative transposase
LFCVVRQRFSAARLQLVGDGQRGQGVDQQFPDTVVIGAVDRRADALGLFDAVVLTHVGGRASLGWGFSLDATQMPLATRYEKLAIVYRGGVVLRAITLWAAHLSDTP